MRALILLCCAIVVAPARAKNLDTGLITNAEFFELIKDYVTDIETEPYGDTESEIEDDDVINLPGGPDDELDLEFLADKLGLIKRPAESSEIERHHHHHHHHHHQHHRFHRHSTFSCHCRHYSCKCCLHHTFKVNLIFHKVKFRLHACLQVAYLRRYHGFEITFTMNGRRLLHKEYSLRHPPSLCYGVPGLRRFAKICLQLYNINLSRKRICARLTGVLDLKFKKFRVHLKLGCFRIPIMDEEALTSLLNDKDFLQASMQASDDDSVEIEPRDFIEMFLEHATKDGNENSLEFSEELEQKNEKEKDGQDEMLNEEYI
ncbi:uncharacterized protein LOC132721472 [Ruditapes philippinarum]|uniref:uncharacterized protein LOC132721472 n=1 Tax=Ruditapes philippinarum TaxID=129788 RepID=UPI00295A6646|nr:uncharacterized protein LOC132721472 [Ruditapes philippinarum]